MVSVALRTPWVSATSLAKSGMRCVVRLGAGAVLQALLVIQSVADGGAAGAITVPRAARAVRRTGCPAGGSDTGTRSPAFGTAAGVATVAGPVAGPGVIAGSGAVAVGAGSAG